MFNKLFLIDVPSYSKMDKQKGSQKQVGRIYMEIMSTFINAGDKFIKEEGQFVLRTSTVIQLTWF